MIGWPCSKPKSSSRVVFFFIFWWWLLDKIVLLSLCTKTEFLNVLRNCLCLHLWLFLSAKTAVISSSSACHPEIQVHFSVRWGCVILWYQNYFEEFCQYFAFCSRTREQYIPFIQPVFSHSDFLISCSNMISISFCIYSSPGKLIWVLTHVLCRLC